jgi:hypothetical protein
VVPEVGAALVGADFGLDFTSALPDALFLSPGVAAVFGAGAAVAESRGEAAADLGLALDTGFTTFALAAGSTLTPASALQAGAGSAFEGASTFSTLGEAAGFAADSLTFGEAAGFAADVTFGEDSALGEAPATHGAV